MAEHQETSLVERLERLEGECRDLKRQTRRWKRASAAAVLGVIVLATAGARQIDVFEEIEAERVVIKGDDGKVYAELGVTKRPGDGTIFPALQFRDSAGKLRTYVGRSEFQIYDQDERPRFNIMQWEGGRTEIGFHEKSGWTQLSVGQYLDGAAGIHLFGPDGQGKGGRDHGGLFVMQDGSTLFHLFRPGALVGKDTHERVALSVGRDGSTRMVLRGSDFRSGINASIPPEGKPKLTVDGAEVR